MSIQELKDQAVANAVPSVESWKPEKEGDILFGWLDSFRKLNSEKYGDFMVVVLGDEEGVFRSVVATTIITKDLIKKEVPALSFVSIRFDGEATSGGGNRYKKHTIGFVLPDADAWECPDWATEDDAGGPTPFHDETGVAKDEDVPF